MKRRAIIAGVAAGAAAIAAGVYRFTDLLVKHYPATPYDDVLDRLADRDQAAALGRAALKGMPDVHPGEAAARLRTAFSHGDLAAMAAADADAGRVMLAGGWVLPQSVVMLSVLAASA